MAFKNYSTTNTKDINYEVLENYGVISNNGRSSKELRLVRWNNGEPKYDLRPWTQNEDGTETANKGITLTAEELQNLYEILKEMDTDEVEESED